MGLITTDATALDLGTASNMIARSEMIVRQMRDMSASLRANPDPAYECAAEAIDGAANVTEKAFGSLRWALRTILYDCEREPRPYNRSDGA